MMPWRNGGLIGRKNVPSLPAAGGVWRLSEIEAAQRSPASWPVPNVLPVTSGVLLWLDANEPNTLLTEVGGSTEVSMNGAIAQWSDRSGSARDTTQAAVESRPILATSANNRRCVRFDGSNDFLTGTHGAGVNSPHTVIVAFRTSALGAAADKSAILLGNRNSGSSNRPFYGIPYSYNTDNYGVYAPFRQASIGMSRTLNPFLAYSIRINTTNTRIGVTSLAQLASPAPRNFYNVITLQPLILTNDFEIGRSSAAATSFTSMDVHEVLIYNSNLGDSEVNLIIDYLASKWGTV